MKLNTIHHGDAWELAKQLPDQSVQTIVTSPPYWGLRDYGEDGQFGLEKSPKEYVDKLVALFRELRRGLRDDGTLWLNLGDSYANVGKWGGSTGGKHANGLHGDSGVGRGKKDYGNLKPKDLVGIPWRTALALQADGWYLRSDIIWHKPNPMPESVKDRPTSAHEYVFLLSKSERYYYDHEAIKEPAKWERWGDQTEKKSHPGTASHLGGKTLEQLPIKDKKNKRSVWKVATKPYSEAHFATFPPDLIEPCILAGAPVGGVVLDPFIGSGTTATVATKHHRQWMGFELNEDYIALAKRRIYAVQPMLLGITTPQQEEPAETYQQAALTME